MITFQDQVNTLLKVMIEHIEKDVPEYGNFIPILEFFNNLDEETQDIAGKYGLKIYKMPKDIDPDPKMRYLEAAVYEPGGSYKADMVVARGCNADIIAKIQEPEFPYRLNISYGKLLDALMHY